MPTLAHGPPARRALVLAELFERAESPDIRWVVIGRRPGRFADPLRSIATVCLSVPESVRLAPAGYKKLEPLLGPDSKLRRPHST